MAKSSEQGRPVTSIAHVARAMRPGDHMFSSHDAPCCRGYAGGAARADLAKVAAILSGSDVVGPTNGAEFIRAPVDTPAARPGRLPDAAWPLDFQGGEDLLNDGGTAVVSAASAGGEAPGGPGGEAPHKGNYCSLSVSATPPHSGLPGWQKCCDEPDNAALPIDKVPGLPGNAIKAAVTANGRHEQGDNHRDPDLNDGTGFIATYLGPSSELRAKGVVGITSRDPEDVGDNEGSILPAIVGGSVLPCIDDEKDPSVVADFDVAGPTPACVTEIPIDSCAEGEGGASLLQMDEPGSCLATGVGQNFSLDTIPEEVKNEGPECVPCRQHGAGVDGGDHNAEALSLAELSDEAEIVHTGVVARKRRRNDRSKVAAAARPLDDSAGSTAVDEADPATRPDKPLPHMSGCHNDLTTDAHLAGVHRGGAEFPSGIKHTQESDVGGGGGGGPRLSAQSAPTVVVWSGGSSDAESKTSPRALRIVEESTQPEPGPNEQRASVVRRGEMSSAGRGYPRSDSLTALMLKLAQLDLEVGPPLGLSGPSSSSSTPTNTPKRRHCSVESDMDTTLTPGPPVERPGLPPTGTPVASPPASSLPEGSGARPKAPVLAVRLHKEKAELEAKEACDWLRAAGFPQYAQLYEDSQFPISIGSVVKDHDFLDRDSIEALCRRLNTLNNCASMKLDRGSPRKRSEDSDDEDLCAISDKWMFQRASRRWSRLEDFEVFSQNSLSSDVSCSESGHLKDSSPSHESLLTDLSEQQEVTSIHSESGSSNNGLLDDCRFGRQLGPGAAVAAGVHPSKWPSEVADAGQVLKDATNHPLLTFALSAPALTADKPQPRSRTKSLLKRMENFRAKGHSHKRRVSGGKVEGLVISGPVSLQGGPTEETLRRLNCVDIAEAKSSAARDRSQSESSFLIHSGSGGGAGGNGTVQLPSRSSSYAAGQQGVTARGRGASSKRGGMYLGDFDALAGHLCDGDEDPAARPPRSPKDVVIHLPKDHKPGTFPRTLSNESLATSDSFSSVTWRTGSFNSGSRASCEGGAGADEQQQQQQQPKRGERRRRTNSCSSMASRLSVYDNVPASQLLLLAATAGDLSSSGAEDGDGDAGNNGRVFSQLDDILQQVNGLQEMVSRWTERLSPDEPEDSDSARDSTCNSPASSPHQHMELDGDAYNSTSGRTTPPSDLESTGTSLIDSEDSGIQDRRESSTGQSVARPNRRQRLRWHSFQTSHRPSLNSASLQINSQSVSQMSLVRKFSLLRLTALMERYSPSNKQGWNWGVPKFMRRMRTPDYKDRSVFGVPLLLNVQRTGQPLPQSIQQAMRYLRSQCLDQVGLFRKSGVKSRIQALREMNESGAESVNYEGQSAYDVADMLKQYFRDLPEPMFTSKLADTFLQIYQYVPKEQQLQALQAGTMLLPDENREALQTLLYFLSDVAAAVGENQMSSVNLAVCLAPSLFHLNTVKRDNSTSRVRQRKYSTGKPDQKDLSENLAAIQGLAHMITECKKLFKIPEEMVSQCRSSYMEHDTQPMSLAELGAPVANGGGPPPASPDHRSPSQSSGLGPEEPRSSSTSSISRPDYQAHLESCIQGLLKEARDKFKGWVTCSSLESSTEVAYKKVGDGHLLRLWKTTVEVEAPPPRVLQRIRSERHLWDEDLLQWKVVETLDPNTEVFYYVLNSMAPHPARDYLVLRSWRTDLPKGSCVLVATSVEHEEVPCVGEARAVVLASRYLIEPLAANRSRLTHVCRIDTRGRSLEWYNKVFGHLCASKVAMIRDSFKKPKTDFPETKV